MRLWGFLRNAYIDDLEVALSWRNGRFRFDPKINMDKSTYANGAVYEFEASWLGFWFDFGMCVKWKTTKEGE